MRDILTLKIRRTAGLRPFISAFEIEMSAFNYRYLYLDTCISIEI